MRTIRFTIAVLGLGIAMPQAVETASAQDVRFSIDIRLGDGHLFGVVDTRRHYAVPRETHCEADGPYLYCWEPAYCRSAPVVVYVYQRPVIVRHHPGRGHARGHARQVERDRRRARERAERAYRAWVDDHGYRYRDGVEVRIVWRR